MSSGIYAYWDNVKNYYVYVGKDSNIDKKIRHNYHILESKYNEQQINRVLQNNPERYEYRVIMEGNYNNWQLDQMEKLCIKSFKTFKEDYPERSVFNFTRGGEGISGYKKSHKNFKYNAVKDGFQNGEQKYCIRNKNRNRIISSMDKNELNDIAKKLNAKEITEKEVRNLKSFKYKVVKAGFQNGKQKYCILDENHDRIITSINKNKLEKVCEKMNLN